MVFKEKFKKGGENKGIRKLFSMGKGQWVLKKF